MMQYKQRAAMTEFLLSNSYTGRQVYRLHQTNYKIILSRMRQIKHKNVISNITTLLARRKQMVLIVGKMVEQQNHVYYAKQEIH